MARSSLCSYTYNDAAFLHGLLESVSAWSVLPDEIVLMDDGSSEPFRLTEAEKALPIKLLRHEINLGFTRAKHDCLCAATGDLILAMDCDARVTNDFLELCVQVLQDQKIGMITGQTAPPVTDDYSSWYVYTFSFGGAICPPDDADFANVKETPEKDLYVEAKELLDTGFIGGGVFALRRNVWEEVGRLQRLR